MNIAMPSSLHSTMPSLLIAAVVAMVMPSCSHSPKMMSPISQKEKISELSDGEALSISYAPLNPQNIMVVGKDLLLFEPTDSSFFVKVDMAGAAPTAYVAKRGMGPMEFLDVSGSVYNPQSSSFFLFSQFARRAFYFDVLRDGLDLTDATLTKTVGITLNPVYSLVPLSDGRIVTNTVAADGKMFGVIDDSCRYVATFGDYPGDKTGLSENSNAFFMGHQTEIAVNPSGNRIVAAGVFSDWLAFYAVSGDQVKLCREYFTEESDVEVRTANGGGISMRYLPTTKTYYSNLVATEDYLYAVYRGYAAESMGEIKSTRHLLQFDWNGDFIKGYILEPQINLVTVTPDDRYLIAVTHTGDDDEPSVVMRYPLVVSNQ